MADDSQEIIRSQPADLSASGNPDPKLIDPLEFQRHLDVLGDPVKLHALRVKLVQAMLQAIDPENIAHWDQQSSYAYRNTPKFDVLNAKLFVPDQKIQRSAQDEDESYVFYGDHIHHIHIHVHLDELGFGRNYGLREIRLTKTTDTRMVASYEKEPRREKISMADGTEVFKEIPQITPQSNHFDGKRSSETDNALIMIMSAYLKMDSVPPGLEVVQNPRYIHPDQYGIQYSCFRRDGWEGDGEHKGWTSEARLSFRDESLPLLREHLQQRLSFLKTIAPAAEKTGDLKTLGNENKILYIEQRQPE